MKVFSIDTGHFKLDGGAMFGVVPKTIWNKMIPADDHNLCSWTMRCLLVDTGDKVVLVDTGLEINRMNGFSVIISCMVKALS